MAKHVINVEVDIQTPKKAGPTTMVMSFKVPDAEGRISKSRFVGTGPDLKAASHQLANNIMLSASLALAGRIMEEATK
jgi:hypothetical protein